MRGELEVRNLADVPALIRRERAELAQLVEPERIAVAERRAAAIAELTRRAGLAIPVQNEATLLRAEALQRLAVVVGEAQQAGEIAKREDNLRQGSEVRRSDLGKTKLAEIKVDKRRLAEGRALAGTDVLDRARRDVEKRPDKPLRFNDLVQRASRLYRVEAVADKRRSLEREARLNRARQEALGMQPFRLDEGDARTWRPDSPVHAIVTDPPYVTADALELYAALANFALDVLPEGGALAVMVWPPMLADVVRTLARPELVYRWSIVWRFTTHDRTPNHQHRVFDDTKLVLVYHRGGMPRDAQYLLDVLDGSGAEKDLHPWQQSLAGFEWLVDHLSWPGETVCDPFAGAGTTGVAALRTERLFVGCDVDAEVVAVAKRRLAL